MCNGKSVMLHRGCVFEPCFRGHNIGIYESHDEAYKQCDGFSGSYMEGFDRSEDALKCIEYMKQKSEENYYPFRKIQSIMNEDISVHFEDICISRLMPGKKDPEKLSRKVVNRLVSYKGIRVRKRIRALGQEIGSDDELADELISIAKRRRLDMEPLTLEYSSERARIKNTYMIYSILYRF